MARKSLADEIIEMMEQYLKDIDAGDKHFNEGVLKNNRSAAHFAIANAIGTARAIREARYFENVAAKKKRLKKQ